MAADPATNAVLEHKGAVTGLITTGGFRDLLEIGNQKRPSLYDLRKEKPTPLVPARLRLDVPDTRQFVIYSAEARLATRVTLDEHFRKYMEVEKL